MTDLHTLNDALASVADAARRSTVLLGRDGRASGVVIADGIVLTNAHALRDRTISVHFPDGRVAQAEVLATDVDGDLATLRVDTAGTAVLTWAEVAPQVGHLVAAGHGDGSVAVGNVQAVEQRFPGPRGRSVAHAIAHSAAPARGASGGPLVNVDGHLIGLNTNRTDTGYQAVDLTGPTRTRVEDLLAGRSHERRRLGVALADRATAHAVRSAAGLDAADGLLVRAVTPDGPAARAGLVQGDVLVAAAGQPTPTLDALATALDTSNDTITVEVVRGNERRTVEVDFRAAPVDTAAAPDGPDAG